MRPATLVLVLALAAGCWRGAEVAPATTTGAAPARAARCRITDVDITPAGDVRLAVGGRRFATLSGDVARLVVSIADTAARATVETEEVVLTAALELAELPVRARGAEVAGAPLHDGWLGIRRAAVVRATGDALAVEVPLPTGLLPRTAAVTLPCADATFEAIGVEDADDRTTRWVAFDAGAHVPLLGTPDGPALATIVPGAGVIGAPTEVVAGVVAERGGLLRVRIVEDNIVEGWVPAAAVRPAPATGLGGFGFGATGTSHRTLRCDHEVPIFVMEPDTRVTRVGHYKVGATIRITGSGQRPVVGVDLGEGELPVYVQTELLTGCE